MIFTKHARILPVPFYDSLAYARLDWLGVDSTQGRLDFLLDYQELYLDQPPEIYMQNEKIYQRLRGHYLPRRLRFMNVSNLKCTGLYQHPEELPAEHGARSPRGMLHYSFWDHRSSYLLMNGWDDSALLMLDAPRWELEERAGAAQPAVLTQPWATPPPLPAMLVPLTPALYQRFGGDPVTYRIGKRLFHRRLFVGGIDKQTDKRPTLINAVLNLCEDDSRWVKGDDIHPSDRRVIKGEGSVGMSIEEITAEAGWVIERLRLGKRVLVHCTSGFNRSVTICCAVIMLLETLPAEAALERVRQHHPWARPDGQHWLKLKWLGKCITHQDSFWS